MKPKSGGKKKKRRGRKPTLDITIFPRHQLVVSFCLGRCIAEPAEEVAAWIASPLSEIR
jgi:hypothetical protein